MGLDPAQDSVAQAIARYSSGCNIYGKAEYYNPGESVKDRAALFIVEDALKKQLIKKNGTCPISALPGSCSCSG